MDKDDFFRGLAVVIVIDGIASMFFCLNKQLGLFVAIIIAVFAMFTATFITWLVYDDAFSYHERHFEKVLNRSRALKVLITGLLVGAGVLLMIKALPF